jgi:hypothetical protein
MKLTEKLYPLYFPTYHRCHACQKPKIASAVVIYRKHEAQAKAQPAPRQKKAVAGGRSK